MYARICNTGFEAGSVGSRVPKAAGASSALMANTHCSDSTSTFDFSSPEKKSNSMLRASAQSLSAAPSKASKADPEKTTSGLAPTTNFRVLNCCMVRNVVASRCNSSMSRIEDPKVRMKVKVWGRFLLLLPKTRRLVSFLREKNSLNEGERWEMVSKLLLHQGRC
jgi:hypothetical protein